MGPASGYIRFSPVKDYNLDRIARQVALFGYGGNTALQLQGTSKGPVGGSFLKLGEWQDLTNKCVDKSFEIYNKGPLSGVAIINIRSKSNSNTNETSNVIIAPKKCIIGPDSSAKINVTFRPKRNDLKKLLMKQQNVLTVATLEVIYGDAPNRIRMAKLIGQLKEQNPEYNTLDHIISNFPIDANDEVNYFDESTVSIFERLVFL